MRTLRAPLSGTVIAGGVVLSALLGVALAAPAFADSAAPSGPYNYTGHFAGEQMVYTAVWTFSSCGQGCVSATADKLYVKNWQFHLNNRTWSSNTTDTSPCFRGGEVPVSYTATLDAATLTGQWTRTWNGSCGGDSQPGTTETATFELTQG